MSSRLERIAGHIVVNGIVEDLIDEDHLLCVPCSGSSEISASSSSSILGSKDSSSALSALQAGNARYVAGKLNKKGCGEAVHRSKIAKGQAPPVAVLGCADSRVPVELVFDADAGEIFTVRVAGNVVSGEALASLEYACKHLGTHTIVIMGHTKCGAVAACCGDWSKLDGHLPILMHSILPATKAKDPVVANVLNQIENMKIAFSGPVLSKVKIVGAIFDLESGKVKFL